VDVPRHRRVQLAAARNLTWGLAILLLSLGLIGAALIFSGSRALIPLALCLITFTLLWVLARVRLFHQRNGVFFAAALVCLLGSSVPLVELGYVELNHLAHNRPAGDLPAVAGPTNAPAGEPEPVLEKLPEAPSSPAPAPAAEPEPPSLVDSLNIKLPEDSSATLVRVIEDTRITVGGKRYLLHAGDIFVLDHRGGGQVSFQANDLRLRLPESAVEIMAAQPQSEVGNSATASASAEGPPAAQSPAATSDNEGSVTSRAQAEAVRRYPAIGVKGSPENQTFLAKFNQLKVERPEFFEDEEWPIYLAEAVAKEEGWQRVK
jgi:hypothetical protein